MAQITYPSHTLSFEVQSQNLYKITTPYYTIETYKIGTLDENDERHFDAILAFEKEVDKTLMDQSIYVARGICMHDKQPVVVSFGGPIGKFDIDICGIAEDVQIDKDVQDIVYFYLKESK